jgi:hypothetical protein
LLCFLDTKIEAGLWACPTWRDDSDYLLCLQQHNKNGQCLHWLNGGEIQWSDHFHEWSDKDNYADDLTSQEFFSGNAFMLDDNKSRIKPRKEKLWLAVKTDKLEFLGGYRKVRICSHAFVNKSDAEEYLDLSDSQLIEIEVEI